ncbi:VOC family protein [Streptomyces thermocarboxydovorans]|uniref:VOC family protein n=1 Tax=Streptomyces thermocarboxydovorans TaxID=59298 RepID=A0ABN1HVM4_9ACTN
MTQSKTQRPTIGGIHHFSPTVTDVEASADWYQRVFGLERVPAPFPHYGSEDSGYAILLTDPNSDLAIGLHHHDANKGEQFDETRTGLDHLALSVPNRAALEAWVTWLDELGIPHAGITDMQEPFEYSVLVFRDPDNIQLELFAMAG